MQESLEKKKIQKTLQKVVLQGERKLGDNPKEIPESHLQGKALAGKKRKKLEELEQQLLQEEWQLVPLQVCLLKPRVMK